MALILMITYGILMLSIWYSLKDTAIFTYKKYTVYIKEIKNEERKVIFPKDTETDSTPWMFFSRQIKIFQKTETQKCYLRVAFFI